MSGLWVLGVLLGRGLTIKIPILKATPKMIVDLLRCVEINRSNIPEMKNCIHNSLQKISGSKKKRNIRSDVYGIAFPSLRKLRLIVDRGQFLQINSNGKLLLKSYSSGGKGQFKFEFGRILLEIDKRKAKVIESLLEGKKNGQALTFNQLVALLIRKGVETHEKDERLRKWLPFLKDVNLISNRNNSSLEINLKLLKEYEAAKTNTPFKTFVKQFFDEYEKLEIKEGIYVPIYKLEMAVGSSLIQKGYFFNTFDFQNYLIGLLNEYSSLDRKKIVLSEPGKREEEGIYVGKSYYYYISIYDMQRG